MILLKLAYMAPVLATALIPQSQFHHHSSRSKADFATMVLLAASSGDTKQTFVRNKKRKAEKMKRSKPNSSKIKSGRTPAFKGPRPVLNNYEANRNHFVNRERLNQEINCEHFGQCSGCVANGNVGSVEIVQQSAKLFFSSTSVRRKRADVLAQGLEWATEEKDDGFYKVVVPSEVTRWRTQAKLAVSPKSSGWAKDGCQFGLYKRGTHDLLSIPNCAVHHPSINRAVDVLVRATERAGTPAFAKSSRENGLRYIQLQVERLTGKVALTLVWNAETLKQTHPSLSRLVKELNKQEPDLWHSIWCNCNDSPGNNIFSRNMRRWHRLSGPEFIREPLPYGESGWLYFSPLTFRQGNLDGFDVLAVDVAQKIPPGSKVCELYGGVGLLGLTALAYHADSESPLEWLRCSDENPVNPKSFRRSVDSLPPSVVGHTRRHRKRTQSSSDKEEGGMTIAELASLIDSEEDIERDETQEERASYMVASAGDALKAGQALGAQVLIVDPPRKGLEDAVIDELSKPVNLDQPYVDDVSMLTMDDWKVNWANDIQTLIYVSCGFDALARDCERLLSGPGGWTLHEATGYILFPGSDHVETVCIFKRD